MKKSKCDICVFLIKIIMVCGLFWLIDSYVVNKYCENINSDVDSLSDSNDGPRTLEDYSEEERQIYSIVMDECIYDVKLRYQATDNEEFYIVEPCVYVAKDVVRAIFNSGTLSPRYTIHDVYQETKERAVKVALEKGMIIKREKSENN